MRLAIFGMPVMAMFCVISFGTAQLYVQFVNMGDGRRLSETATVWKEIRADKSYRDARMHLAKQRQGGEEFEPLRPKQVMVKSTGKTNFG